MKISAEQTVSHPAALVFSTVRDKQPELVRFMPNIAQCTVVEREEVPPEVRLLNRWQAKMEDIPRALRSVVNPDLMSWNDRAVWNADTQTCNWVIESIVAKGMISCTGTTTLKAQGDDACLFSVAGDISISADKIPGIPKLIARTVRDPLERLIAGAIRPNLTGMASAVQRYLDENPDPK